ncbi:MAG: thioredoxin fold domain-containing protein [candidate division Zixibacteria bacterium]|nr:thioredoxin fold domain-containing protein [candidate division Zixibacteria bacterium]
MTKIISSMTLWLVIGVAFFGCQKKKAVPTEITFQSDLRSAREVARAEKKPLLVEFYKTGCSWCRKMDDSTFTDKIIIELSDKILFLKLDAGIDTAEAARFGVTYYPTVVLLKPDGDEIDRLVGYYPPPDFYNEIQLYLQGRETLEDYLTRLQDEPRRADYIMAVAEKYRNRADWNNALGYYRQVLSLGLPDAHEYVLKALFEIAVINGRKGDYQVSLATFADLLKRPLDTALREDALRQMAYYTAKSGDTKQAIALYMQYLDNFPNGEFADWARDRVDDLRSMPAPADSTQAARDSKQEK